MTELPRELRDAWTAAAAAPDPLQALAVLSTLRGELSRWEAMLARQALADGASWATIGEAQGTSRQAAWERLRPLIKQLIDADRHRVEAAKADVRRRGAAVRTTSKDEENVNG